MELGTPQRATIIKLGIGALAAIAGGGLGLLMTAGGATPTPSATLVWIDQPLDGSQVANAPVAITAHATDPDGVATIVMRIDGTTIPTEIVNDAPALATAVTNWSPTASGTHELRVVASGSGGHVSEEASATFSVVGDDTSAVTTMPTATTSTTSSSTVPVSSTTTSSSIATTTTSTTAPTSTSTTTTVSTVATAPPTTVVTTTPPTTAPPTTSPSTTAPPTTSPPTTSPPTTSPPTTTTAPPCVPSTPVPTSPRDGERISTRTPTLSWAYRGCGPDSFTIDVADNEYFLSGRGSYVASVTVAGAARSTSWEALPCNRTYYWRMSSSVGGSNSPRSTTRTFYLSC